MGKDTVQEVRSSVHEEQRGNNEQNSEAAEESAEAAGNLQALQEIKQESDSRKRGGKVMGFIKRFFSYFKFNKKYKKGDMTTGENKQRSGNGYENFLLAKIAFQSGGNSYQAQEGASLTMSGGQRKDADISSASLDRLKDDGGESVDEAAVNFIDYRGALRLYSPKAVFRRKLFGGKATADYSSDKAMLNFMGDFRDLSVEGGTFHLTHEYLTDTDKFGEIASMDFNYNENTGVKTGLFFLGDGANDVSVKFKDTNLEMTGQGFNMKLGGAEAQGRTVTANTAAVALEVGIFNKKDLLFNGGITLDDSGFSAETASVDLGVVSNYKNLFNAESAQAVLHKDDNGSPAIGVELGKWDYGFKMALIELQKEGDSAQAELDKQGRLHIHCPGNLEYRIKLIGKDYFMPAIGDTNELLISDKSAEVSLGGQNLEVFGKTLENARITAGLSTQGAHHVSITADKAVVQESDDGNITLTNIDADIGDKGLEVKSAKMEITGSLGELTVDEAITGEVNGLSITKEGGVEFERFKVHGENIHNDVFSVEAAEMFAARTAATGLVLSVGFSKLKLTYEGGDDEEEEEKDGGLDYTVITDELSGSLSYCNKSVGLVTTGAIKVRVQDLINFTGKDISYVDKTLKMSEIYVGLYNCDKALSFGDYFSASALHFHGENIAISSRGLLDKQGLMRLTLKDLCILGTNLGNGTVEVTNEEVKATISKLPMKPISLPQGGTLTFSGGFGMSINKAKKISPITKKLAASVEFPWLTLEAKGFTSDENTPFKIESLTASSSVLPGILNKTEMEVSGLALTSDKKLTFESISFTYNEMYPLINDVLSVGNPKIGFYQGFDGFMLGGAVKFTSKYFEGAGSVTVDLKKEDGFAPHISNLENIKATIPKLATASVKSVEFETDDGGKKTITLKGMSLSGYKQDEESKNDEDSTLFDRLCASAQNLKVELKQATYDCALKKFNYQKSDLTFQATKMEVDIVDGISGSLDFTQKKLSVESKIQLPSSNFPGEKDIKAENIPHLLELGGEVPVFPFVGVGGSIFAGAYMQGKLSAGVGVDNKDKNLDLELGAELSAGAGIGLDAHVMLGMSKMFNLKLGLRGTLLAVIPSAEIIGNLGLSYQDGFHLNKENTSVSFDTTGELKVKLDAFVKGQLFGFINTDLLTFNIKTFNIGTAKFSGSAGFDNEGKWQFDKSFTFSSDFAKDGFDPDPKNEKSIIACTKKQVKEIDDLKNSLGNYEKVYGIQDWGSEDAMVKSAKMQTDIFPMFKDIRANNKKSFDLLKQGDSQIVDKLLENEQAVAKHQRRDFQSRLAGEGITGENATIMEAIIMGIIGEKNMNKNKDITLLAGDIQELKKHEPARVAGFLYKRFGILFDEKPFSEISEKYFDVRLKIARAKDKITSADVAREKRKGFLNEYSKFVDSKDKNIDKYFSDSKSSFNLVLEKDKALTKINDQINDQISKFTDRIEMFEEYYRLRDMKESKAEMTESEKLKLESYQSDGSPIKKDERKIFREYKANLDKKQMIIAEAAEARAKLSSEGNAVMLAEVARQNGEFAMHRSDIDEQTNAIIESAAPKSDSPEEYDVSFLNQMMVVPSKKTTNTVFDMRELKKLYPVQLKDEADEVERFSDFKRICNRIMELNEKETLDFYTAQFNKKITKKTRALDKEQQPNNDYYRMIYSSHAVYEANKSLKAFNGKKEDTPTMLNALQEQNQGRIDYYENSTKLTRDTMSDLQKNILDSNDLFIRANDLFFKLNAVTPEVLTVKDEGSDITQKPASAEYISSLNTLSQAGEMLKVNSEDRTKLSQLHTQSKKISTDVEKVMTINRIGQEKPEDGRSA